MVSMLEESHVQIHVHADDWEDAIRKAGNVLVAAGSIDASYIEHMIQSVKTLGPYIVIIRLTSVQKTDPYLSFSVLHAQTVLPIWIDFPRLRNC